MNLYDTIMKNSKLVNITKKSDVLELNTTFRLYNTFCKMEIKTVNDIIGKNIMDFMKEYGCGIKTLQELKMIWEYKLGHRINEDGIFVW